MDELFVELVEIGLAHHHEKTYDHQQIAGALLRHTLRQELLEQQSGPPRQRNFQIPEVEDEPHNRKGLYSQAKPRILKGSHMHTLILNAGVYCNVWPRFLLLSVLALTGVQADRAGGLYAEGVELYNAGDYGRAVELLSQAAALDRDVPDYRYHLALAYLKVGRPKEAARELESTLGMMGLRRETRVKEPTVLLQAAIAYLRMGNFKAARLRIENALDHDDTLLDAHYVMGLIVKEEGDEEAAAKHFETVLEIDRDHREANMALAEWLERIGEAEAARENLRHASHGTNDNFEILLALGGLSYRLGDLEAAVAAFEQAYEKQPSDEDAAFNLGAVRLAEQRFVEAVTLLRPLVERDEPHDGAAFNFAIALHSSEDYVGAREALVALLGRDPDHEGASFSLAVVSEALEDDAGAERAYREAIRKSPSSVPAFLNLAALLERLERPDEAVAVLKQTLELPLDDEQADVIREAIESLEGV